MVVAALLGAVTLGASAAAGERDARAPEHARPVLVELFTSQGCSSCPPADRLLSRLSKQENVLALAFHVDYWNYIGWTDPFSSAEWSARQRRYRESFALPSSYTPQVVVDGRFEGVGSDAREVEELLARARLGSAVSLAGRRIAGEEPAVEIEVGPTARSAASGQAVLMLAVPESGLETEVARGENGGRSLRNDNVVRALLEVAHLELGGTTPRTFAAALGSSVPVPGNARVVAFLQDGESMAVLGAAALDASALD